MQKLDVPYSKQSVAKRINGSDNEFYRDAHKITCSMNDDDNGLAMRSITCDRCIFRHAKHKTDNQEFQVYWPE